MRTQHPGTPGSPYLVRLTKRDGGAAFVRPCDVAAVWQAVGPSSDGLSCVELYGDDTEYFFVGSPESIVRALGLHEDGFRVDPGPAVNP